MKFYFLSMNQEKGLSAFDTFLGLSGPSLTSLFQFTDFPNIPLAADPLLRP